MQLINQNQELDNTQEHEIFSENEFGFKVTVTYKKDSWMSKHKGHQVVSVFNNCAEVHYLYETIPEDEQRIAFESDIHGTGCTRNVDHIESVVIELASQEEENFWSL